MEKMQCPSCRKYIDADYDLVACKPTFTVTERPTRSGLLTVMQSKKVQGKARSAQLALLQEFQQASPSSSKLRCPCGDELKKISVAERRAMLRIKYRSVCAVCDVCKERISDANATHLWTCSRGGDALLHPRNWDVCDRCVQKHAHQEEKAEQFFDCEDAEEDDEKDDQVVVQHEVVVQDEVVVQASILSFFSRLFVRFSVFARIPRSLTWQRRR